MTRNVLFELGRTDQACVVQYLFAMQLEAARLMQEASSAIQSLTGLVILALVPLGVAGSIYKAISPNGWVAQMFGQSISAGAAVLGALAVVLVLAWFGRAYRSPRRRNANAGLFVYFFAAAGLIYALQLLSKGSL
ncbi:MAG: hypothetical protein QOD26_272 [Betaproteobacteria bacterium]|jgi:hypothetical protein|nr:hypothetical protein [Betaproteobacteria bacterium]